MKSIHLVPSLVVLLQAGVLALGMASWLGGEDDEDGDAAADDFDVGDDFDDFDEEFGGLDAMDESGGGTADRNVTELENRIEQMETEMANVSSKANTVRSENEQISESVDDVEENVRKLLEIYEMVTRGVNPFVDDVSTGGMIEGTGGNSFGLFDDDGEDPDDDEDLDDDIASAEAEDFFDDDALDGFDDGMDEFDDEDLAGLDDTDEDEDDGSSEGGTSFEDLKAEYESGEAAWADEDLDADDDIDADEKPDLGFEDEGLDDEDDLTDDGDGGDLFLDEEPADESDRADDAAIDVADDTATADATEAEPADADDADTPAPEPAPEPVTAPTSGVAPSTGLLSTSGDAPHLQEPPSGYLADVVVLEWLTGLLDEFGPRNTVRTLNYYERIGWISDEVRSHFFQVLEGLSDSDHVYRREMGTTELTMDDHLRSLEYIEELADGDLERGIIERCETLHADGIQR